MTGNAPLPSTSRVLVLGIGNLLMGDEGVGVHAVRTLRQQSWPFEVEILDGGTGGFHLLSYLREYPEIVMIDATMDGQTPGTVSVTEPRFACDFPRSLGAHDIGLRDLIESAILLGPLPTIHLVTVSVGDLDSGSTELSPAVQHALRDVVEAVRQICAVRL